MRVIDLLNKIAIGEEVPKKIRIDHWCYKFEWKDYARNYIDEEHEEIDLMSCLSCDKEELNYEVHEINEENGLPEKLTDLNANYLDEDYQNYTKEEMALDIITLQNWINQLLDYLEKQRKGE